MTDRSPRRHPCGSQPNHESRHGSRPEPIRSASLGPARNILTAKSSEHSQIGFASDVNGKRKRLYDTPKTPLDRLLAAHVLSPEQEAELLAYRDSLNPAAIGRQIAELQVMLLKLAKDKTEQLYLASFPTALPDIRDLGGPKALSAGAQARRLCECPRSENAQTGEHAPRPDPTTNEKCASNARSPSF